MINLNLVSSRCLIIINSSSNYHIRSSPFHRRFPGSFLAFSVSCSFFSRDVYRIRPYYTYTYYFPVYEGVKYTVFFFFFFITIIVCHLFIYLNEVSGTDSVYCFLCLQVLFNSFGGTLKTSIKDIIGDHFGQNLN